MATTRNVDFGAYTTNDRGLPRDQGYANNWAKENAKTFDVISSQLPGLAGQVKAGKVTYASVGMGTNDFLFFAEDLGGAILGNATPSPAFLAAEIAAVEANAATNFDTTVNTLLAANSKVKVIVQTTPDIREVPLIAQFANMVGAGQALDAIAAAQEVYNDHIRAVAAAQPRVGLADVAAETAAYASGSATTLPIGGINLQLTKTGDDYHDVVLADKIHPGTIAQGLIANAVIQAADTLGAAIKPITAAQIVSRAKDVAAHYKTTR